MGDKMICRVGITTNLERRKKEWKAEHSDMQNWEEFGPFDSREDAQKWEDSQTGCEKSGGGDNPDDPTAKWSGYRFSYS